MNDTTNPIIMGLLFVLRCLIPLGILFGISYLLRRLELVIEHADEEAETAEAENAALPPAVQDAATNDEKNAPIPPAGKKKTPASKKKKEAKA